jgi:8-oxo-dGTP pyrophosphatase MutT (NUDIX family)
MWKKIKSREIFKHPRLTLIEDDVLLPNGVKTKYLRWKKTDNVATIICQRGDGKILVSREFAYPMGKKIYQFPGGGFSINEDPKKGANRELMEEVGLRAKKLKLIGKHAVHSRRTDSLVYIYLVKEFEDKKMEGDQEEKIENFWFSESEIDKLIQNGKIVNHFMLAAWPFYKLRNN